MDWLSNRFCSKKPKRGYVLVDVGDWGVTHIRQDAYDKCIADYIGKHGKRPKRKRDEAKWMMGLYKAVETFAYESAKFEDDFDRMTEDKERQYANRNL